MSRRRKRYSDDEEPVDVEFDPWFVRPSPPNPGSIAHAHGNTPPLSPVTDEGGTAGITEPQLARLMNFDPATLLCGKRPDNAARLGLSNTFEWVDSSDLRNDTNEGATLWDELSNTMYSPMLTVAEHLIQIFVSSSVNASTAAQVQSMLDITLQSMNPLPKNYPKTAKRFYEARYLWLRAFELY